MRNCWTRFARPVGGNMQSHMSSVKNCGSTSAAWLNKHV